MAHRSPFARLSGRCSSVFSKFAATVALC
jgi:hypothetical protein